MNRPIMTLFLLTSLDGKISTGDSDLFDFDKDLPKIEGPSNGLHQYYEIEKTTDIWSLSTGVVWKKMIEQSDMSPEKTDVNFIVVDTSHLTAEHCKYIAKKANQAVVITSSASHPATKVEGIIVIHCNHIEDAFEELLRLGADRITVQSGGSLNSYLLKKGFIDKVHFVVAPILIGGVTTPSAVGGPGITSLEELMHQRLMLDSVERLSDSYLSLKYFVLQ